MFPRITGKYPFHLTPEDMEALINRKFRKGVLLKLNNNLNSAGRKFTLSKRNNLLNPFEKKILFGEIRGEIKEDQISYEIRVSTLWEGIIWIDTIILLVIAVFQLIGRDSGTGIAILGFLVIMILTVYYWAKSEMAYLERLFIREMNNKI